MDHFEIEYFSELNKYWTNIGQMLWEPWNFRWNS